MAFFKFGSDSDANAKTSARAANSSATADTVEDLRRRAKQRLIGASALVLLGVIGFPLLFDSQPRPIAVDIPIEIPDKNKAAPLTVPSAGKASAAAAAKPAIPAAPVAPAKVADSASLSDKEEILKPKQPVAPEKPAQPATNNVAKSEAIPESKPEAKPEVKVEAKPVAKPAAKPEAKPEAKPTPKPDDAAKAKALLDGQSSAAASAVTGRFIVQVGAFADAAKARETRSKVERSGLKTYTQEVNTADGKRIRVRVGPFANKAEADKAASTIKGLDLPASILTL